MPSVSLLDFTAHLADAMTIDEVNQTFRDAADGPMQGILAVTDEELVSSDFIGDTHSAVVDATSTMTAGPLVKVNAWYDNEWGYANRVCDMAQMIAEPLTAIPVVASVAQPVFGGNREMAKTRIAFNGFGRTGRQAFKAIYEYHPDLEVVGVAIRDLGNQRHREPASARLELWRVQWLGENRRALPNRQRQTDCAGFCALAIAAAVA